MFSRAILAHLSLVTWARAIESHETTPFFSAKKHPVFPLQTVWWHGIPMKPPIFLGKKKNMFFFPSKAVVKWNSHEPMNHHFPGHFFCTFKNQLHLLSPSTRPRSADDTPWRSPRPVRRASDCWWWTGCWAATCTGQEGGTWKWRVFEGQSQSKMDDTSGYY